VNGFDQKVSTFSIFDVDDPDVRISTNGAFNEGQHIGF